MNLTMEILQDRTQYIRRRRNEADLPECARQTVKHPNKIMVWGGVSMHGTGRLHVVTGTMNSEQYLHVLDRRFLPQMMDWYPDGNAVLMHDGAPCHRSRAVNQYLAEVGLEVLPWPGNSPDMNPIEGLWKVLKDKVHGETVTNKRQLTERILQFWHHDAQLGDLAR